MDTQSNPAADLATDMFHKFWEIDFSELEVEDEIGRGAFGSVFKGEWRNSYCVVKQLQANSVNKDSITSFLKEANTVKYVTCRVWINTIGFWEITETCVLSLEYAPILISQSVLLWNTVAEEIFSQLSSTRKSHQHYPTLSKYSEVLHLACHTCIAKELCIVIWLAATCWYRWMNLLSRWRIICN